MSATHCPVCCGEWVACKTAPDSKMEQPTIALYCDNCGMHRLEYPGESPDSAPIVYEAVIRLPRWNA